LKGWGKWKLKHEMLNWKEKAKKAVAKEAAKHVENGFILGLGSGSTTAYAIKEIGKRICRENLKIYGIPTSYQAMLQAIENRIPLTTLYENPEIDLTIDGADQIDKNLNLIKGHGGALTREKIVASASKKVLIIADETKLTEKRGKDCLVPIEVLPFAFPHVKRKMEQLGAKTSLREAKNKVGPVITDNGNLIVDANFGIIENPEKLEIILKNIPGIVETGLFIEMADAVLIGGKTGIKELRKG